MQILSVNKRNIPLRVLGTLILVVTAATFVASWDLSYAKTAKQRPMSQETFNSPEAAVEALVNAVKTHDEKELMAVLGPAAKPLVSSGDPVADQQARARFLQRHEEKHRLVNGSDRKVILEIGKESWPLPIPIVMRHGAWLFDTEAGKDEILNRRIGRNELSAIQVCLAYVDAQREYADIMGVTEGRRKYAQKFLSEPGKKDGLYWKTEEGEKQSPLGPLVANAQKEGYRKREDNQPTPYHGYIYKLLKAQGRHAARGAYDYVVNADMIGGFALVARPAIHGASGIMTFMVSDDGVVYEKNWGKNTEAVVQKMNRFDPDKTWRKVDAKYLNPPGKGD